MRAKALAVGSTRPVFAKPHEEVKPDDGGGHHLVEVDHEKSEDVHDHRVQRKAKASSEEVTEH